MQRSEDKVQSYGITPFSTTQGRCRAKGSYYMFISSSWGQLLWHTGAPWCLHPRREDKHLPVFHLTDRSCAGVSLAPHTDGSSIRVSFYKLGFWFCFLSGEKKKKKVKVLQASGWVLTKRERRKAGEDMETVSCKRKTMHIRAVTQRKSQEQERQRNCSVREMWNWALRELLLEQMSFS